MAYRHTLTLNQKMQISPLETRDRIDSTQVRVVCVVGEQRTERQKRKFFAPVWAV